ncbi:MAG: phosphatase domain-containing protein [Myxococcota bacterium]
MRVPKAFFELAYEFDRSLRRARATVQQQFGVRPPLRIVPYRGYGTRSRLRVRARVLLDRGELPPELERGMVDGIRATVQRFRTEQIAHCPLTVRWETKTVHAQTDEEGFLDELLALEPPEEAGWRSVELSLREDDGEETRALCRVVDRSPRMIITDIDDTLIDSHITNRLRRAEAMFLGEVRRRRPFPETAELLQALARGAEEPNPVFYVSSSPWNLHDHLDHFLSVHDFPLGPILLRDWGLHRDGFAPDGRHGHKREKIETILADLPAQRAILIGDSGQRDAENYRDLVWSQPERIAGVMIRRVAMRPGRVHRYASWTDELRATGIPFLEFTHSREAFEFARRNGWVP